MEGALAHDLRPSRSEELRLEGIGFRWGGKGTHTSRTIMLEDLRAVLARSLAASREDYLAAIKRGSCFAKRTTATRKLSSQRLSELSAVDLELPLFPVPRRFVDRRAIQCLTLQRQREASGA